MKIESKLLTFKSSCKKYLPKIYLYLKIFYKKINSSYDLNFDKKL